MPIVSQYCRLQLVIIPYHRINIINYLIFIVIEISLGEYGDNADKLVKYIDNGKSTEWLKNTSQKHKSAIGW